MMLLSACAHDPGYQQTNIYDEPGPGRQRVADVALVTNSFDWFSRPSIARPTDSMAFPKAVIFSDMGFACVMSSGDELFGEWASVLPRQYFDCPSRWRRVR